MGSWGYKPYKYIGGVTTLYTFNWSGPTLVSVPPCTHSAGSTVQALLRIRGNEKRCGACAALVSKTRWWQLKYSYPRKLRKIPMLTNIFQMGWNHQPESVIGGKPPTLFRTSSKNGSVFFRTFPALRIMGSQRWWFEDPRTLSYRSTPIYI